MVSLRSTAVTTTSATYPASDQIERVVALLTEVLGEDLAGAYLYGSAVAGGLKPGSDLDLFVIAQGRTTPAQRQALIAGLRPLSSRALRPATWRPVELTVAALADLVPQRYPPRVDFQSGEWLRAEFDAGEQRPWRTPNPDLLIVLSQARQSSQPLVGPPASELLTEIPTTDLARAMTDEIASLLDDLEPDTANVLLTLARIWHTLATGSFAPKDAAANWVLAQLDEPLPALELARDEYLGTDHAWAELQPDAVAAARLLIGRIEGLAGPSYNRWR